MKKNRERYPVLIVGTGIAGLSAALTLAELGIRSLVITKAPDPALTNTGRAQGGIVWRGEGDSPESLAHDIAAAGGEIVNRDDVAFLAEHGPRLVERLLLREAHVPFARHGRR